MNNIIKALKRYKLKTIEPRGSTCAEGSPYRPIVPPVG